MTSVEDISQPKCVPITGIESFSNAYKAVHIYFVLVWCPLGLLSNILNIIVLNQKSMRTPTNVLLTSLAISDAIIMLLYIPFATYFIHGGHITNTSLIMSIYLILHINLQNMLHVFSCGTIVTLAVFRLIYARCLLKCQELCTHRRALLAIIIVVITSTVFTIPCMVAHTILPLDNVEERGTNTSMQDLKREKLYMVNYVENKYLHLLLYWNTAIFVKLIPLLCLICLSTLLIITIHHRAEHASSMRQRNSYRSQIHEPSAKVEQFSEVNLDRKQNPLRKVSEANKNREKSHNRTTRLLLAVMIVYIVTVLPQVILLLLSGFMGICFSETVYDPLGDFMDLLTLLSCGTNFVLYCSMSQQFRLTFLKLFCPKQLCVKYIPV